jgi:3-methylfumaryl-CoA hydratase
VARWRLQAAPGMTTSELPDQLAHWRQWIGRTERRTDLVTAAPIAALAATLDQPGPEPLPGSPAPALAHWLYFLPVAAQGALGPDGHPQRGGFLPPVPLPRRMWAGGRLDFLHPLHVGDEVERVSRIMNVDAKAGRSGTLVFVTVRHEVSNARGLAIAEEHDIVYRDAPSPSPLPDAPATEPLSAPGGESFSRALEPDAVLLFRYSALTFNGHRIHYDRPYATEAEGYPGLVVHGPLLATLLVDLLHRERPHARLRRFAFTALRPVFDTHPIRLCGRDEGGSTFPLWVRDHEGLLAMRAEARTV